MWLPPLAQRAAQDGQQKSLAALVDQMVQFHTVDPDHGKSALGLDDGAAMRRLLAENCLSSSPGPSGCVRDDGGRQVLLGPRYHGPPYRRVHNHGVMANLVLLQGRQAAGQGDRGSGRCPGCAPRARSCSVGQGMSYEQSSQLSQPQRLAVGPGGGSLARAASAGTRRPRRSTQVTVEGFPRRRLAHRARPEPRPDRGLRRGEPRDPQGVHGTGPGRPDGPGCRPLVVVRPADHVLHRALRAGDEGARPAGPRRRHLVGPRGPRPGRAAAGTPPTPRRSTTGTPREPPPTTSPTRPRAGS